MSDRKQIILVALWHVFLWAYQTFAIANPFNENNALHSLFQGRRSCSHLPFIQSAFYIIIKLFSRHPSGNIVGKQVAAASHRHHVRLTTISAEVPLFLSIYVIGFESHFFGSNNIFQSWDSLRFKKQSGGVKEEEDAQSCLSRWAEGRKEGEEIGRKNAAEETGVGVTVEMPKYIERYRVARGMEKERKNVVRADRAVNQPRARLPISSLIISDNFSGPSELARPASFLSLSLPFSLFFSFSFFSPRAPRLLGHENHHKKVIAPITYDQRLVFILVSL